MQTATIQNPSLTSSLGTSVSTILASPPASTYAAVSSVSFCNKSGGQITVQCSLYNGTTDFYIAFNSPIAVGDTLVFGGEAMKFLLANGFSLRALCNTASACDVVVTYTYFT
jgi:hypothetical protein